MSHILAQMFPTRFEAALMGFALGLSVAVVTACMVWSHEQYRNRRPRGRGLGEGGEL